MKSPKKIYTCSECGYESPKWMGKCPVCGKWNTFDEEGEIVDESPKRPGRVPAGKITRSVPEEHRAKIYSSLTMPEYMRVTTGFGELDRVLGGGLVTGSVVLLAGEPGIGKSTLLTQICGSIGDGGEVRTVLYVSGEESRSQLKLRAERLGIGDVPLYVLTECDIAGIISEDRLFWRASVCCRISHSGQGIGYAADSRRQTERYIDNHRRACK